MRRASLSSVRNELQRLDFSLSGLLILGIVAGLHMTSAGIDLVQAAEATVLGPEQVIQLMDIGVGAALALFPFLRARVLHFRASHAASVKDCSFC